MRDPADSQPTPRPCVIIVDPIASGRFLAAEFAARGVASIAVFSQAIPARFEATYFPERFSAVIDYDGDFDRLVARLSQFAPMAVAVGLETGLDLTDRLAERLGLPGNDPRGTEGRRDKYVMHETLKAHGVRSIRQCRVTSVEQADAWLADNPIWPLIVKPTSSAGSDDVQLCHHRDEVLAAVTQLLGSKNLLAGVNHHALLQEYLQGREWVVDTVSCNGQQVTCNIGRYLKVLTDCSRIVYQHTEFFAPDGNNFPELIAYAAQVNQVLGIRHGAAHHEIIVTADGPVLVEVNARMHGIDTLEQLRACRHGLSQLDLTVDCHVAPHQFAVRAQTPYPRSTHVLTHYLIARSAGTVAAVSAETALRQLTSYRSAVLPRVGQRLAKTTSATSSPGHIWLVNDDPAALWHDQQQLLAMEADGSLYQMACMP